LQPPRAVMKRSLCDQRPFLFNTNVQWKLKRRAGNVSGRRSQSPALGLNKELGRAQFRAGPGLEDPRYGHLNIAVRHHRCADQVLQHGIFEELPPPQIGD
jgi:hypothetical protein